MVNAPVVVVTALAAMFVAASPRPKAVISHGITQAPGQLTRADFVERLEHFYRQIDTKTRGYFTTDDLTLPGHHIPYPPVPYPSPAEAAFRCVDANRDGRISHEEYVGYGARAFDATAPNGVMENWNLSPLRRAISSDAGCK